MKKVILYLFLFVVPAVALAQTPGYMGKKLTVIYNNYFSPALQYPNYQGNTGVFSFNSRHSFGADYVRGRKRVIGLAVQFLRTRKEFEGRVDNSSVADYQYSYSVSSNGTVTETGKFLVYPFVQPGGGDITISNTNFSLYWKFFGRKYIAPWGNYHRIDFILMNYRVKENFINGATYAIQDYYYYQATGNSQYKYRYETLPSPTDDKSYFSFMFAYGIGKQRVLYDKIVVDLGAQLGLMFGAAGAQDRMSKGSGSQTFNANMQKRINNASWLNINIGLGYLAY